MLYLVWKRGACQCGTPSFIWTLDTNFFELADGNLATTFAWKLTNGGLTSVSYGAGSTQMVESIAMVFQKLEIDATAGGITVSTLFNWQTPIA